LLMQEEPRALKEDCSVDGKRLLVSEINLERSDFI
jgi:hypothetical protein